MGSSLDRLAAQAAGDTTSTGGDTGLPAGEAPAAGDVPAAGEAPAAGTAGDAPAAGATGGAADGGGGGKSKGKGAPTGTAKAGSCDGFSMAVHREKADLTNGQGPSLEVAATAFRGLDDRRVSVRAPGVRRRATADEPRAPGS